MMNNFNVKETTLEDVIYYKEPYSVLGKDLEALAQNTLRKGLPQEVNRAKEFMDTYFVINGCVRPIPTAYYQLYTKSNDTILIRRNSQISPSMGDVIYAVNMDKNSTTVLEDAVDLSNLLECIVMGVSLTGNDIRRVCVGTINRYKRYTEDVANSNIGSCQDEQGYPLYQIQVAQTVIDRYFSNPEKAPGAEVYYKILLPQIGSPRLKRDLEKSPRNTK